MSGQRLTAVTRGESRRTAGLFPSFRDFVDDALFHPEWGYYSTGRVRFGEGGHYDTFPLALSPVFGHMLAQYGYRFWRRAGEPQAFEICELGAGNGQLCRDVLVRVTTRARREEAWRPFANALRYRIVERSRALIARQQEQMGPLSDKVVWTRADLAQRAVRASVAFTAVGMVFANEVLDCLAHHKVVQLPDGLPGVVFVVPTLKRRGAAVPRMALPPSTCDAQGRIPRDRLAAVLADERLRRSVAFEEVALPIDVVPPLHRFVRRYYPEFYRPGVRFRPYFACPAIETLVANTSRLYERGEILWVDYGDTRNFHLKAPEHQKIFAGPPCSGATVYRAPGLDDITFLVDFSVVAGAARRAGLRVQYYGGQAELSRASGVRLDRRERDLILRQRMLDWLLAVVGVGPEREWRRGALTWSKRAGKGGRVYDDVRKAVDEFMGRRRTRFRLMILR